MSLDPHTVPVGTQLTPAENTVLVRAMAHWRGGISWLELPKNETVSSLTEALQRCANSPELRKKACPMLQVAFAREAQHLSEIGQAIRDVLHTLQLTPRQFDEEVLAYNKPSSTARGKS